MNDLGDQGPVSALLARRSDAELAELMESLGGNCVTTMAEVLANFDHDRLVFILAYTIKGWGTPIAGHKDNHGGLMTKAQMADWRKYMQVPDLQEWDPFATVKDRTALQGFLKRATFFQAGRRRFTDAALNAPEINFASDREISTQMAFGKIPDDLAKG